MPTAWRPCSPSGRTEAWHVPRHYPFCQSQPQLPRLCFNTSPVENLRAGRERAQETITAASEVAAVGFVWSPMGSLCAVGQQLKNQPYNPTDRQPRRENPGRINLVMIQDQNGGISG